MELDELLAALNQGENPDEGGDASEENKETLQEGKGAEPGSNGQEGEGKQERKEVKTPQQPPATPTATPASDAAAQFAGTLDSFQFSSMMQNEIDRFFKTNHEISDPLLKNKIISLAIAKAKQGFASGQIKPMYEMLETASEDVKEDLVRMLNVGAPVLRELAIKKGKDKRGEFWKKASQYSMGDYFKDYYKDILPALTVKGMEVVRLEKGYGQDKEEYYGGKAPHFNTVGKTT